MNILQKFGPAHPVVVGSGCGSWYNTLKSNLIKGFNDSGGRFCKEARSMTESDFYYTLKKLFVLNRMVVRGKVKYSVVSYRVTTRGIRT